MLSAVLLKLILAYLYLAASIQPARYCFNGVCFCLLFVCLFVTIRINRYTYHHKPFKADGQWLWDHVYIVVQIGQKIGPLGQKKIWEKNGIIDTANTVRSAKCDVSGNTCLHYYDTAAAAAAEFIFHEKQYTPCRENDRQAARKENSVVLAIHDN